MPRVMPRYQPLLLTKEAYANWHTNFVCFKLFVSCRSAENKGRMTSHAWNNREIGLFDGGIISWRFLFIPGQWHTWDWLA